MIKVLVIFHSITGNVMKLAKAVYDGTKEVGVGVAIKRVPETVPKEILEKNPGLFKGKRRIRKI